MRKSTLINLADKPLRTRPSFYSHHRTSSRDGFSRLSACALILAITFACFWMYDLIAHRAPPYDPPRAHVIEYRSDRLSAPEAVAPDMNSDAVRHANADVPAELPKPEQQPELKKAKHAAVAHRKKKVIARRPAEPAMQAFAWGPRAFQVPFGGY